MIFLYKILITAQKIDPHGEPIFTEGSPKKLADPFDFGGGLVNSEKAGDPGFVYDMGGYNDSSISIVEQRRITCPRPKFSILDMNVPSINLQNPVTLTRTVTNIGHVKSTYKVEVEPPLGITVDVWPKTLVFDSSTNTKTIKVPISTSHKANTWYYFGSLTWTDGIHNVMIPISIRRQIIRNSADDY